MTHVHSAVTNDIFAGIKVIDVDTHISEPRDLWTSRAPAKWRDRVPQMRMLDGRMVSACGGAPD